MWTSKWTITSSKLVICLKVLAHQKINLAEGLQTKLLNAGFSTLQTLLRRKAHILQHSFEVDYSYINFTNVSNVYLVQYKIWKLHSIPQIMKGCPLWYTTNTMALSIKIGIHKSTIRLYLSRHFIQSPTMTTTKNKSKLKCITQ